MLKDFSLNLKKVILGVVILLPLFTISVHADLGTVLTISGTSTNKDNANIKFTLDILNEEIQDSVDDMSNVTFLSYLESGDSMTLTLASAEYNLLNNDDKQEVMEIALSTIRESKISTENKNKIYNFVSDNDPATSRLIRQLSSDVNPDFGNAYTFWSRYLTKPVSALLGFLVLFTFALLSITITLDLAYINIPFMQVILPDRGALHIKEQDRTKTGKPMFVSYEAYKAVHESENAGQQDYRSPMFIYLKLKSKSFIGLAICLLYLLSGHIYTLIAQMIDAFRGFTGV